MTRSIGFATFDGLQRDGRGRPRVGKKKGGNRLSIQYRWYLTFRMEGLKAG